MNPKLTLAGGCVLVLLAGTAASAAEWVQTWGAAPLPPSPAMGPFPATPVFVNQTIRQTIRVSVGGAQFRLRLTNEYGTRPLEIGAVRVALADEHGDLRPGTERPVLFSGKPAVSVPAGSPYLSDPVDLPVSARSSLSVSLFVPEDSGACTCHASGMETALVSAAGDFTGSSFKPASTMEFRAFLAGVDVKVTRAGRAVVVMGDSISDGAGSTVDANHRWPDFLANRLNPKGEGGWGVVNMGISGNRVLSDGAGESALARFDRDVLATPGVKNAGALRGRERPWRLVWTCGRAAGRLVQVARNWKKGHGRVADRRLPSVDFACACQGSEGPGGDPHALWRILLLLGGR